MQLLTLSVLVRKSNNHAKAEYLYHQKNCTSTVSKENYNHTMNGLKNLAGNDVAIFLFRFEIRGNAISFVVNQEIAMDMYEDVDKKLKPLAHACCETLSRYRQWSVSDTIMDGNFLDTGEFEVMLSKGLGRYFPEEEKQQLFQDAKRIADLLDEVMLRRTKEEREGVKLDPYYMDFSQNPRQIKKGLAKLGHEKSLQSELQWMVEGKRVRPGLRQLTPDDLPAGVKASRGYDHRGQSYVFEHKTIGELGRIVMIKLSEEKMLMQSEIYTGQAPMDSPIMEKRKKVFGELVATVSKVFEENFPDEDAMHHN